MKTPTVYDVAQRAGVSIATVSRVLRRPDDVREQTRRVVHEAILELGYVPSGSARGLAARQTGVLGLCFPDVDGIDDVDDLPEPVRVGQHVEVVRDVGTAPTSRWSNLYIGEVMRGAELEAWRTGLAVMITVARGLRGTEAVSDLAGRVDGLAVLSATVPDDLLAHIARRIPVVVMAGPRRGDAHDHISVDNSAGVRALVEHLVQDHGIRDLAFVGGPVEAPDDQERFSGFRSAVADAGLPVPVAPLVRGDFTRTVAREIARSLLAERRASGTPLPRALVCSNDQTALGILDVFTEEGIDVPGDVVLTGFDGIDATQVSIPRLTTVRQPMVELGRAAVERLRVRMADPAEPPATINLPVRVLLRESCGCH
ncbi:MULTISPECIES: LacI family DNA-binding transcriptional regulator [Oerskovia]|uniref:LacI family DNA-binding transcriptional regulator n=2 Tax=Oerskovia TaxID=162491 RepID=A0ABR8V3W4_9CELL|nr:MULTISPECIES: LacI family DNA-binding transcriptional regulator [Oerskovia]MBD7999472.1 LacI family DNA-binding transcriptional regulator [Oerskovia gallyi]MBM7495391.1 LacI family transcriptional regulator [Oerskovia paurometabola]